MPIAIVVMLVTLLCVSTARAESAPAPVKTHEIGKASYYGKEFAGKRTASGKKFDPTQHTAASRHLPLGTEVEVKNLANGKTTRVVVTDRGPYKKGRIIDLSKQAAKDIEMIQRGTAPVMVSAVRLPDNQRD